MRNSEAQKYARWSLAAAGLLAVVVAGVYAAEYLGGAPGGEEGAARRAADDRAAFERVFVFQSRGAENDLYREGVPHDGIQGRQPESSRRRCHRRVREKRASATTRSSPKPAILFRTPGKSVAPGKFRSTCRPQAAPQASANAIQVATSAVTFDRDSGEARTDKPVTFHWPAGEGRAVGVSYDSNSGTLRLLQERRIESLPFVCPTTPEKTEAAAEKIVHVAGDSMSFQRETREVQVEGDVHAQQTTLELTADKLLLELDAAFQARRFVASGHPQLHDLSPQGPLALSADEIDSGLRPDGSIESIVATGNVHGTRNTPVGRGWNRCRTHSGGPRSLGQHASPADGQQRRHADVHERLVQWRNAPRARATPSKSTFRATHAQGRRSWKA